MVPLVMVDVLGAVAMSEEVRLWRINAGDDLREIPRCALDLEARLEAWLERDISCLDPHLLVIGRQVETDFGGSIDLLCLDQDGDVVVVELKRDKTPRDITAQVLDYGSWVADLSHERVTAIAEEYLRGQKLDEAFRKSFAAEPPDVLNSDHRLLIVASEIDTSSERIITYLSDRHGVNINAATFQYFKAADGSEFIARAFLLQPAQVETRAKGASKRRPTLSYPELERIAEENGVGELYRRAVEGLGFLLQKHRTQSSIAFEGSSDGGRKTTMSLIPGDSSAQEGLRFQVYTSRLQELFDLSEQAVLAILPMRREPWSYYQEAPSDLRGFRGFFATKAELEHFLESLAKSLKVVARSASN